MTAPPAYTAPTTQPALDPPAVVTLSLAGVPVPRLVEMRRALIASLCTVEDMLGLPPEKRAIRNRAERRNGNGTIMDAME